jgi:hypothetical protein
MPSKSKSLSKLPMISNSFSSSSKKLSNNSSSSTYIIGIIGVILTIGISFFILDWLIKVDKCKCANIDESLYLKEWYMFLIVYQIIAGIFMIANNDFENSGILFIISLFVSIIAFVMIVRLLIYIHKLKEIKCDCGMTVRENIIYYFYIVGYSIALFIILLAILGTLFLHR